MHLLTKDFYPLAAPFESSFQASDLLVEEVDFGQLMSAGAQMLLLTRGHAALGPVARFGRLARRRWRSSARASTSSACRWRRSSASSRGPWRSRSRRSNGRRPASTRTSGLDKHFYDLAQTAGKPVQGLETAEYQISRFDEMSMPEQEKLLTETVKDLDTELTSVGTLADAWKNGDQAAVERIVLKDLKQDPLMYQRLLVERNNNWLPKIEALFVRPSPAFVVVGAAHLVGPDGLLAKLRAKGYTIEQM